jgi:outer membrane receptor protein involved in Fe transport
MRRGLLLFVLFPLFFPSASSASEQSQPTELFLSGTVLDPMRAPIPGALVTATPSTGSGPVSATTDSRGTFILSVTSGQYSLLVHADGFRDVEQRVTAGSATSAPTEFVLQVAGVREAVTVTAPGGYQVPAITTATRTPTPLLNVPQSVTIVTKELIKDQMMTSVGDVMRYVPGVMVHQGENNRDQVIIRGNSSSADFFVDGVRDDVQYYRDLYNLERVEVLKGPNAMIFGRGGVGGIAPGWNVRKQALFGGHQRGCKRQRGASSGRPVRKL